MGLDFGLGTGGQLGNILDLEVKSSFLCDFEGLTVDREGTGVNYLGFERFVDF